MVSTEMPNTTWPQGASTSDTTPSIFGRQVGVSVTNQVQSQIQTLNSRGPEIETVARGAFCLRARLC